MIKLLFRISVSLGLAGMGFGIFMGIRQDFALAPAHAHLNLLGFVVMFLSASSRRCTTAIIRKPRRAGLRPIRRSSACRRDRISGRHRLRDSRRA
jgi:hypothetical protein